jgi:hypothetical protein
LKIIIFSFIFLFNLEKMYQNPEYFINPLGVWAKTDIKEILDDMEDGELSEDGWKKVSTISGAAFKLIGKAVETKVEWIPILGTLVGKLTDARAMQEGAQELLEKSTAAKKWHYIQRGLDRYRQQSIDPEMWQTQYERKKGKLEEENKGLFPTMKWKEDQVEKQAREFADDATEGSMAHFIKNLDKKGEEEGEACYFFYRAYLTKIELKKPWWKILSYDPERVEIEDPLMHGEPYPEII